MLVTPAILERSVAAQPFGTFEPFVSGDPLEVETFYRAVLGFIDRSSAIALVREPDHHGSGYASYISAFLYPQDGSSTIDMPEYLETTGILLYLSRLAPIAVFGRSSRTENKANPGGSSGFISPDNLSCLPPGDWSALIREVNEALSACGVEMLAREPLLHPAPAGLRIPTAFDGPYCVFDALFYWED